MLSERLGLVGAGGLPRAAVHEWFRVAGGESRGGDWSAPLAVLAHVAERALDLESGKASVLWIGRAVWPYPRALVRDVTVRPVTEREAPGASDAALHTEQLELAAGRRTRDPRALLDASILVDVSDAARRLWAIDLALRCSSVAAVVADASGLDMAATRRLQLAAEAGEGLGLLARPPWEQRMLSAAATRWRVRPWAPGVPDAIGSSDSSGSFGTARDLPCWKLELLRCKSVLGYGLKDTSGEGGADGAACAGF